MKSRLIILFAVSVLLAIFSCVKEDDVEYVKVNKIIISRDQTSRLVWDEDSLDGGSAMTRSTVTFSTSYTNWFENKDTLGIFPKGGYQIPFEVKLDLGVDKTESVVLNAEGWETKVGVTYATYMPFDFYNRYSTAIPFSYLGQVQNYTPGEDYNTDHLGKFLYERSEPMFPDSLGMFYAVMQNLGCYIRFRCTMPAGTPDVTFQKLVIHSTDPNQFIVKGTLDLFGEDSPFTPTLQTNEYTFMLKDMKMNASRQIFVFFIIGAPCAIGGNTFTAYLYSKEGYTFTGQRVPTAGTVLNRNDRANVNFTMSLQTSPQDVYVTDFSHSESANGVAIE